MNVTIIGCGNMGLVYARAFLRYEIVRKDSLLLVEKNEKRAGELCALDIGAVVLADDPKIRESRLVILAVKPQDFAELAPILKPVLHPDAMVLSIMAGIRITAIEQALGHHNILRAMPNSPVEVGMGMTGFSAHPAVNVEQIRRVENLLSTTGRTVFFAHEEQLDAVTALSGSGPAYFYYIVRAMIDAGKQMGMDEAVSAVLVKQTMLGAFQLINNASKPLDELIKTVASKGGTTEAALSLFESRGVSDALIEGIVKAEQRAKELSKN